MAEKRKLTVKEKVKARRG